MEKLKAGDDVSLKTRAGVLHAKFVEECKSISYFLIETTVFAAVPSHAVPLLASSRKKIVDGGAAGERHFIDVSPTTKLIAAMQAKAEAEHPV